MVCDIINSIRNKLTCTVIRRYAEIVSYQAVWTPFIYVVIM